jgi:prepilin peptidase CpaA
MVAVEASGWVRMSLFALFQVACLVVFGLLLLAAAWQDLRTMRIADSLSLAIAAVFAIWALSGLLLGTMTWPTIVWTLVCAMVLFSAGAAAFAIGALGGGDVKLLAAASLFAGPTLFGDFLMVTALVGGALGLAIMAGAPIGPAVPAAGAPLRARLRSGLPYGPAIAAGGLWVAGLLAVH